ncbi:MAG: hypothetical protein ABIQ72_09865, partial [Usitatibacter sp.]
MSPRALLATLAWATLAVAVAGCELTGSKKPDATIAVAAPEPVKPMPVAPAPAPAPAPPRATLAEIDARLKLLMRLKRFHEAGEFHDANADLIQGKAEFAHLAKQIAEGLNRQYDAPLAEAATSLAKYAHQRIAPDQMGKANEAIAAARDALNEYESVQFIQDLKLTSPAAKRLMQSLERAEGTLQAAEAAMRAPDPRMQRLVAEKKLDQAVELYASEAKAFAAAKPAGPGLRAFTAARIAAHDKVLSDAAQVLKAMPPPGTEPSTWPAAAAALAAARQALDTYAATPPFEIAALRPAKYAAVQASLAQAERNWLARAPDALVGYGHGSLPAFTSAYPVKAVPAQLAERWTPAVEARLNVRPLPDLRALDAALGEPAPAKAREMLRRAVAKAEKAAAPSPVKEIAAAAPPAKGVAAVAPPTKGIAATAPPVRGIAAAS